MNKVGQLIDEAGAIDNLPFSQFGVPCQAATCQLDDMYFVLCCPVVDLPESTEPVSVPMFFRMENGNVVDRTTDPTRWNQYLETRRRELHECNASESNQPQCQESFPAIDPSPNT